jgi:hypothetical protein
MISELREKIFRGPRDTEEALDIAIEATTGLYSPDVLEQRLAAALVEILICKQLQKDAVDARQAALAVAIEIDQAFLQQNNAASSPAAIHAPDWPFVQLAAASSQ